jgi:hypothetical protein
MVPNARKDPFVKRMENAASWLPPSAWYGRKVFLAPLAHEMNIPMEEFERTVIRMHQAGIIELSRADMVQAMDPRLVRASEVHPPGMSDVTYHFWNATPGAKPMTPNHSAVHYVWLVDYRGVPLDTEGPYGPMSLDRAEAFARIGATKGDHNRVVSIGRDIMSNSFEILRRYRRGTGERMQ